MTTTSTSSSGHRVRTGAAGQVVVVHGVAKGLAGAKRTVLRQGLAGAAGAAEAGDGFGSAISVGNGVVGRRAR